jgi:Rhodopirellula transposase DDE domain
MSPASACCLRNCRRRPTRSLVEKDPTLLADLMAMVEPDARGDPMSPLRWACKSLSQLACALAAMGHKIGRSAVGDFDSFIFGWALTSFLGRRPVSAKQPPRTNAKSDRLREARCRW